MAHLVNGVYYLGDPCYVFEDGDWDYVVGSILDNEGVPFMVTNVEHGIQKQGYVWNHGTAYGDGGYEGSDGKEYSVDSGCIGLVAEQLISNKDGIEHGRMIEAYYGLNVDYIDGLFVIEVLNSKGGVAEIVTIMTDDPEEDEDFDAFENFEDFDDDDFDDIDDMID